MATLLVLHGPNLNLLGSREPEIYGHLRLEDINNRLVSLAKSLGHTLTAFQSNAEHELIDAVQQAPAKKVDFIVINPASLSHTSVGLRDAIAGVAIPFIEVHISNIHAREAFRRHSYFSDIAVGVICGLGPVGYELAVTAAIQRLTN